MLYELRYQTHDSKHTDEFIAELRQQGCTDTDVCAFLPRSRCCGEGTKDTLLAPLLVPSYFLFEGVATLPPYLSATQYRSSSLFPVVLSFRSRAQSALY